MAIDTTIHRDPATGEVMLTALRGVGQLCYNYSLNSSGPETLQTSRSTANTHRRVIPVSGLKCTPIVLTPQDVDRFWSKVDRSGGPDACWPWTGARSKHGYGIFDAGGKTLRAHRVALTLENGPIPDGMLACHRCDNPPCCNPYRCLFPGTHADNMSDRSGRGRTASGDRNGARRHPERRATGDRHWSRRYPHLRPRGDRHGSALHPEAVARGSRHGNAKLTEADADAIRERYARGGTTYLKLAVEHKVDKATIGRIIRGVQWVHVLAPGVDHG